MAIRLRVRSIRGISNPMVFGTLLAYDKAFVVGANVSLHFFVEFLSCLRGCTQAAHEIHTKKPSELPQQPKVDSVGLQQQSETIEPGEDPCTRNRQQQHLDELLLMQAANKVSLEHLFATNLIQQTHSIHRKGTTCSLKGSRAHKIIRRVRQQQSHDKSQI